jgi:large subunit ribosomal protein L6
MSRVAKKPIALPSNLTVKVDGDTIAVKGPKGEEKCPVNRRVKVVTEASEINIMPIDETREANVLAGTMRALINNMVIGVVNGFEKKLLLVGVGYRAQLKGSELNLTLGFSHPVSFPIPKNITIETPSQTEIIIKGTNKQEVGQVAANIRAFRRPDPYKGKGVRYADEKIVLKETKKK